LSIKNAIQNLNFFTTLDDKQIDMLVEISSLNFYKKNYVLCYEKSQSRQLIFLVKGLAKSYKIDKYENEIFLYYIDENSMLSEISDINSERLQFFSNISFVDDSSVLSVDFESFKEIFLRNNILNMEFINEILVKSGKLQSLINREFIFDAVTKVSMMMGANLAMFNRLKRQEISLMLNIQPSTLSRVLNRLKRNNIIDIVQGKVFILNRPELELIYRDL